MNAEIREEGVSDAPLLRDLHRAAFGGTFEAELVDRLRDARLVTTSLVATSEGKLVGHILFSDLAVEMDGQPVSAVSLAPMAVLPEFQRLGIGSALVRRGIELCKQRGKTAVIVVGYPEYYPRFGFSAELSRKLQSPFSGPPWMALELVPGALSGASGTVRYPDVFGLG